MSASGTWRLGAIAILVIAGQSARAQSAPRGDLPYQTELHAALGARAAHDDAAARQHLLRTLRLIHGHPDIVYLLAETEARLGLREAAVDRLRTIAAMGLAYATDNDPALATLRSTPGFAAARGAIDANRTPVWTGSDLYTLPSRDLLAEDIAYDSVRHRFLVSSIHESKIVALGEGGPTRDFVVRPQDGFGVEALAVDAQRTILWATVVALPQVRGYHPSDSGRSALVQYDLATGQQVRRYELPQDGRPHDLGDIALDEQGSVIASDGAGGAVYLLRPTSNALAPLVDRGTFRSPQTPVLLPDHRILIADYALGLAVIDPETRAVRWVSHADTLALNGIDGMVLRGHVLYAVQNGTVPERVLRIVLDARFAKALDWAVIERGGARLGEPTHGVIAHDALYLIANSGWDRFRDDGSIKPGVATAPTIVRVSLH